MKRNKWLGNDIASQDNKIKTRINAIHNARIIAERKISRSYIENSREVIKLKAVKKLMRAEVALFSKNVSTAYFGKS